MENSQHTPGPATGAASRLGHSETIPNAWECFADAAYLDMWCVRPVGERRFGHGFHLVNRDEAEGLRDLLNRKVGGGMSNWQPIETAPKDGTWILIRGRNSADFPMFPVVCAWRRDSRGQFAWRDSASHHDMTNLVADVPQGSSADWMPLPDPPSAHSSPVSCRDRGV